MATSLLSSTETLRLSRPAFRSQSCRAIRSVRCMAVRPSAIVARSRPCRSRVPARVVAFKESQAIHDWRTQKMAAVAHTYYKELWSKGDMAAGSSVLADQVVFRDNVWRTHGAPMLVGAHQLKSHIHEMRTQYPDLYFDIEQIGLQDTTHLFVLWSGHGTQLEYAQGPASFKTSLYQGVDILAFSEDRSQIVEVSQFRQPTAEERQQAERTQFYDPLEIKLARLHWEPITEPAAAPQHTPSITDEIPDTPVRRPHAGPLAK